MTGKRGFFPSDYVEIIEAAPNPPPPPPPARKIQAPALFDYVPPGPESMRLNQGEIIEVLTRGEPGGWSVGVNGAFPTDYVEFIADTPNSSASVGAPLSFGSSAQKADPFGDLPIPSAAQQQTSAAISQPPTQSSPGDFELPTDKAKSEAQSFVPPPPARAKKPEVTASIIAAGTSEDKSEPVTQSKPAQPRAPEPKKKSEVTTIAPVRKPIDSVSVPVEATAYADGERAAWRRFLFLDMFADFYVHQMADPASNVKSSTALSRVLSSLKFVRQALNSLNLSIFPPCTCEAELSNVLVKANSTLNESIDISGKMPIRSADPSKLFSFLATLTSRIRRLPVNEFLLFPVCWQSAMCNGKGEHAVLILIRRVNRDTDNDYSVTVINTGQADGLCYHPMKADDSDAAIKYNLSFAIPQVMTSRAINTTFW